MVCEMIYKVEGDGKGGKVNSKGLLLRLLQQVWVLGLVKMLEKYLGVFGIVF